MGAKMVATVRMSDFRRALVFAALRKAEMFAAFHHLCLL